MFFGDFSGIYGLYIGIFWMDIQISVCSSISRTLLHFAYCICEFADVLHVLFVRD